ncbi:MAG TPA: hypothetical protein PLO37_20410 [Candidatus Hydrogenedentes bacterium]|nr:hypothetical protein [Candidatus Hydrogenedentota bacterium]HPG69218.1 hypothetical protein [Candidatus Hydrogenedentota bacterium]
MKHVQAEKLFRKLEDAVTRWTASASDAERGLTEQLEKVRAGLGALLDGAARHRQATAEESQQVLADLAALREALCADSESAQDAEHRIGQLEKTLDKRKGELQEAQKLVARLEHDLAERSEEAMSVKERTKSVEADLARARKDVEDAESRSRQAEKTLAEKADAGQAAQQRVTQLEHEMEDVRRQAQIDKKRIEELEARENDLLHQVETLTGAGVEVAQAASRIAALEAHERELQEQLGALEGMKVEVDSLRVQVDEGRGKELAERERADKAEAELERATAEGKSLSLDLEVTMADLAKAREERDALQEADAQAKDLRQRLDAEKKRSDALDAELHDYKKTHAKSALAQQLAEALREAEAAQDEIERLRAALANAGTDAPRTAPDAPDAPESDAPAKPAPGRGDKKRDFGDVLVEDGVVTREQLQEALDEQRRSPQRHIATILVEKHHISEDIVARALATAAGLRFVRLVEEKIDPEAVKLLSDRLARLHTCIPLKTKGRKCILAMANPMDLVALEDIERTTNLDVEPVVATPSEISEAVNRLYGSA